MRTITGALHAALLTSLLGVLVVPPTPSPPPAPPEEQVLGALLPFELFATGVTHREFTTTDAAGRVRGDVIEVDLADPAVHTDLLTPGAVAARSTVAKMALDQYAIPVGGVGLLYLVTVDGRQATRPGVGAVSQEPQLEEPGPPPNGGPGPAPPSYPFTRPRMAREGRRLRLGVPPVDNHDSDH